MKKEIEKFTVDNIRAGSDLREYHKWLEEQRKQDKLEVKRIERKIYKANPENKVRQKEYCRKHYQKPENKARQKKWYLKNRERILRKVK